VVTISPGSSKLVAGREVEKGVDRLLRGAICLERRPLDPVVRKHG
jgi:hypothetical protein